MSQPPHNGAGKPPAPPPPDVTEATEKRVTAKVPAVPLGSRPSASVPVPPAPRPTGTPSGTRPTVGGVPSVQPARPPPPPAGATPPPAPGSRIPPMSSASLPAMPPPPPAQVRPPPAPGMARPPPPPPAAFQPPAVPRMPSIAPLVPAITPVVPAVAPPPPPAAAPPNPLDALVDLCARLDQMDYFEILQVERTAAPSDIKKAFYKVSRTYHPDRYFQLTDKEVKERVNELYKRATEAYYVLRDDAKRRQYAADVAGPERAQKLRFTESSETETRAATKRQVEEQIGSNPKGRQFFQTGAADADAGRWASAERNLKMALTYEPANPRYKEKLAEVQKVLLEESRKQGDSFKIR